MKQTKELATLPNERALTELKASFPVEQGFTRSFLPRLSMVSQDRTEGKGKSMKVVAEAGTFFEERQDEEENGEGKKEWIKKELGSKVKGIILYQRKQLRLYDEKTEMYTSSPIYDEENQVIPLFCNKAEVARGTPADLKALYQYEKDGKTKSKLEDNRVLYVLKDDEIFQLSLRGSSMYSWMTFAKKVLPPSVLVELSSEPMEKGQISWNKMTFEVVRPLNADEVKDVMLRVVEIKDGIAQERAYYASANKAKDELEKF